MSTTPYDPVARAASASWRPADRRPVWAWAEDHYVPPVSALLVTYAYQLVGDGEVDQAVNEARSWLREYPTVDAIPDGRVPALISYAAGRVLAALSRTAILATVHAGDSTLNLSDLAKSYQALSASAYAQATAEREAFYTQSSEARDPTVADVAAVWISPFTPRN